MGRGLGGVSPEVPAHSDHAVILVSSAQEINRARWINGFTDFKAIRSFYSLNFSSITCISGVGTCLPVVLLPSTPAVHPKPEGTHAVPDCCRCVDERHRNRAASLPVNAQRCSSTPPSRPAAQPAGLRVAVTREVKIRGNVWTMEGTHDHVPLASSSRSQQERSERFPASEGDKFIFHLF